MFFLWSKAKPICSLLNSAELNCEKRNEVKWVRAGFGIRKPICKRQRSQEWLWLWLGKLHCIVSYRVSVEQNGTFSPFSFLLHSKYCMGKCRWLISLRFLSLFQSWNLIVLCLLTYFIYFFYFLFVFVAVVVICCVFPLPPYFLIYKRTTQLKMTWHQYPIQVYSVTESQS